MDNDKFPKPMLEKLVNSSITPTEETISNNLQHDKTDTKCTSEDPTWKSDGFQLFGNISRNSLNETAELLNKEQIDGMRNNTPNVPVKLFVNRIPKWICNEKLKSIFSTYGKVMECNILKDQDGHKGCAFIKFASIYDAHLAIQNIHSKVTLNQEAGPVQIKYADGEIERLGLSPDCQPGGEAVKVFVGCLPKSTTKEDLYNLFSRYGRVDEVYVIRDNNKQPKCSAFITFPRMSMAITAINTLDKNYFLPSARRAIEVRLAERKGSKTRNLKTNEENNTPNRKTSTIAPPSLSHPGHSKHAASNDSMFTDAIGNRHSFELSTTYEPNDELMSSRSSALSQIDSHNFSGMNFSNKNHMAQIHGLSSIESYKKLSNLQTDNSCRSMPSTPLNPKLNEQSNPSVNTTYFSHVMNDCSSFYNNLHRKLPKPTSISNNFNDENTRRHLEISQNFSISAYSPEQLGSYNYPLRESHSQDFYGNIMRYYSSRLSN